MWNVHNLGSYENNGWQKTSVTMIYDGLEDMAPFHIGNLFLVISERQRAHAINLYQSKNLLKILVAFSKTMTPTNPKWLVIVPFSEGKRCFQISPGYYGRGLRGRHPFNLKFRKFLNLVRKLPWKIFRKVNHWTENFGNFENKNQMKLKFQVRNFRKCRCLFCEWNKGYLQKRCFRNLFRIYLLVLKAMKSVFLSVFS